ncbi:hypothetical protein [Streptomyces sp. NPDC093568]|uniref:hypothetical protein n=1 Tax=Streptomyces sp. NPDC093568 TaxID=3366041 RepID=UPI003816375E
MVRGVGEPGRRPPGPAAGLRAQGVLRDGSLVDDFLMSLPIGREVARRALAVLESA